MDFEIDKSSDVYESFDKEDEEREKNLNSNEEYLFGMKFLCAEDNELNAEILQETLKIYGAKSTFCRDGKCFHR